MSNYKISLNYSLQSGLTLIFKHNLRFLLTCVAYTINMWQPFFTCILKIIQA